MGLLSLFAKKLQPSSQSVPQTGVIFKGIQKPDAVAGINPRVLGGSINPSGSWTSYAPTQEKQYAATFDTMSCTSFSIANFLETLLNYMITKDMIPEYHVNFLKVNGYFDNKGSINFSDRFLAITSNTTPRGNDHVSVFTAARKIGMIPEKDFPFLGTTWSEYHNKNAITEEMYQKAARFQSLFDITFEWVFINDSTDFPSGVKDVCRESLSISPLPIAIKYPATHAIEMLSIGSTKATIFDQYEPFMYSYKLSEGIHYGFRGAITPKPILSYPKYQFNTISIPYGSSGPNVTALQQVLFVEGFTLQKYITGNFLTITKSALTKFQQKYKLYPDGICGPKTIAVLNSLCQK